MFYLVRPGHSYFLSTSKGRALLKRRLTIIAIVLCAFGVVLYSVLRMPAIDSFVFKHVVTLKIRWGMTDKVVTGWSGWLFYEPELTYIVNRLPSDNLPKIVEFDRSLREQGMALFVVPIPNKIEIYPEKFTLLPVARPVKKERSELLRHLEIAGVRVVDIIPAFERAKAFGLLFDPYETHWTALGIEVAAHAIAQRIDSALTARAILRDTRYGVIDTILKTRGDLLDRLNKNGASTWYPFPVKRVLCPDGSLYNDDKKSEIMILGDSYVNHGKWWNAHLGAQIARLIGHPTRTYFSLLANTEGPCMFRLKPAMFPKNGIVIWAFSSRVLQYHLGSPEKN